MCVDGFSRLCGVMRSLRDKFTTYRWQKVRQTISTVRDGARNLLHFQQCLRHAQAIFHVAFVAKSLLMHFLFLFLNKFRFFATYSIRKFLSCFFCRKRNNIVTVILDTKGDASNSIRIIDVRPTLI